MMTQNKTKALTTAGVCIALAQILSYIKVFQLPQGGSITAGSMVPIILFSLLYGPKKGLLTGFVYGILQLFLGGKFLHPGSMLLDYFLGFTALGLAGFFRHQKNGVVIGAFVSSLGRFLCSFLSGWLIFGAYAPAGQHPALYSLLYNGSYMLPETIITCVLTAFLYRPLKKGLNLQE